jgi:SAM-dependent methyltransferase
VTVPHDLASERELWDTYAERVRTDASASEPVLTWTQYPGHGPGVELLAGPESVLELGCGTGRALAHLARTGVRARGVDLSPVMVENATERWGALGVTVACADALGFLGTDTEEYDAVYSIFGAAWFCDPHALFPLVARRLRSGGVFVFSQPPAIPGAYGPQGMYKGGFAGRALYTYRYSYTPARWAKMLRAAGLVRTEVTVLAAPEPGHIGTLLGRGVKP